MRETVNRTMPQTLDQLLVTARADIASPAEMHGVASRLSKMIPAFRGGGSPQAALPLTGMTQSHFPLLAKITLVAAIAGAGLSASMHRDTPKGAVKFGTTPAVRHASAPVAVPMPAPVLEPVAAPEPTPIQEPIAVPSVATAKPVEHAPRRVLPAPSRLAHSPRHLALNGLRARPVRHTGVRPAASAVPSAPPSVSSTPSSERRFSPDHLAAVATSQPSTTARAEAPAVPVRADDSASTSAQSETQWLMKARRVLADDPAEGLRLADLHRQRFPSGSLAQERELIAIDALVRLGRYEEAHARVATFRSIYPRSAHLRRLEALEGQALP